MNVLDASTALYESKLRLQIAARRTSLMSTLGPEAAPEELPLFRRRRVIPLIADFVVQHSVESQAAAPSGPAELPKAA